MFPSQKSGRVMGRMDAKGASMRPGCFHPRNTRKGAGDASKRARFNEAGMFPSQKSVGGRQTNGICHASMRPGCFHPRNMSRACWPAGSLMLQ